MKAETMAPAEVALSDPATVTVTRRFAAPRALVVRAFTEPALLTRWLLGPPGWQMTTCEMDVRVGGSYLWRWTQDGTDTWFGFSGRFLTVDLPNGFTHTEIFDPGTVGGSMGGESRAAIEFAEEGRHTRVTSRMDYGDPAIREMVLQTGMTDGMEMSYARLDALIPDIA